MTELEKRIKAKLPGEDTGIEIKHSLCAICSPAFHCGLDCYVKEGKLIKVEGTPDYPGSKGRVCTKGQSNRDYIYRKDRIQTPLKRVGERGEGKFVPITWEEALSTIAEKLSAVKEAYSPHAVAFYSGHCKWYRPILHRLCYAFGSVNFGTDDSTCFKANDIASKLTFGAGAGPNTPNANTFLGWNYGGYYAKHMSVAGVRALKERGGKVIIIDPRHTPAVKNLADLYLQIKPGTDGALALGMGKIIIDNGWIDAEYIEKYVHGYEEYKALVQKYPLDKVCEITGLCADDVYEAARLYATNGPATVNFSGCTQTHHINGMQSTRAIHALIAITGNYDRPGGNVPGGVSYLHKNGGFSTREKEFRESLRPHDQLRIGETRFPIWDEYCDEFHAVDLIRQLEEGTPYPVKAIVGLGMNAKMLPETERLLKAMADNLDFFVDADLFMTHTAKYADIVLPACSSLERGEMKAYEGGFLTYTKPVIEPLYESRSDVEWLCDLARELDVDDELLKAGYEACCDWIIEGNGLTVADLKKSDKPVKVPTAKPGKPGNYLVNGCKTRTGKIEIYSEAIAAVDVKYGLNPLPDYQDPLYDQNDSETAEKYPFNLVAGVRIPTAHHSRLHEVPWLRSLRPNPLCEINAEDAKRLGIKDDDPVELSSPCGTIRCRAKVTHKFQPGTLMMLHGYTEANVNNLICSDHLDPYSGYPGFKSARCTIRKYQEAES